MDSLSAADLERLRFAVGRTRVALDRSIFGPNSVTWRVNREAAVLLGGGRALLLQVAHPLVAAGVAAHSNFRAHPLARLWRTLDLMLTITFADAAGAVRALHEIERVHARVHGVLDAAVGPFPAGTRYDATDPELLLWVYATLVDTALLVYEQFVAPLTPRTRAAYYEESKIGARLFGIPAAILPKRLSNFTEYMRGMVAGEVLAVGPASKEIAASILRPPLPVGLRHAFQTANLFTVGLLPARLRARYGLSWGPVRAVMLAGIARAPRLLLPFVPSRVRYLPHARRAAAAHANGAQTVAGGSRARRGT